MKSFVIYDTHGRILRTGQAPESMLDIQAGEGEYLLEGEANDELHYIEDGAIKAMPPRPSPHHQFDYAIKQWVDPRTLDDLKAAKWEEIKAARDTEEFGGFNWGGSTFDSDALSQQRIASAVQAAQLLGDGYSTVWTLADNTTRLLLAADMQAVGLALLAHVNACHEKGRQLRVQINTAASAAELDAISW